MKPFLLFFVFFLSLSSFMAGWILKGKYETGSLKNYRKASQLNHKQQSLNTPKNNTLVSNQHLQKPASPSEKPILLKPKEISTGKSSPKNPVSHNSPTHASKETKLEKYHSFNQQEFLKIKDRQSFFKIEGKYSFLINVFSTEKSTFEYIKNLKNRFPFWSFFIRSDRNHLRVYLGPFQTKKQALEFIKNIPSPSPFPNYFLEEESI